LRAHNWTTEWDFESQSQYAYSDTGQWVGYDSLRSATLKVNKDKNRFIVAIENVNVYCRLFGRKLWDLVERCCKYILIC
jgi:hypothetical protein